VAEGSGNNGLIIAVGKEVPLHRVVCVGGAGCGVISNDRFVVSYVDNVGRRSSPGFSLELDEGDVCYL
jgi:hypothetical protein